MIGKKTTGRYWAVQTVHMVMGSISLVTSVCTHVYVVQKCSQIHMKTKCW
jgi:hypothetical protein